ncbi:3-oxoacyl-ACP reductase [Anaerobacillus alkalidiazotrophicus]|uniref:3-oxoacyl-ACP reductase n=1 Tax=Anaerobacillus alkalidiazotrophicus TaxID=472963 RepID=A0A1S2M528_9BACI|nr:SDR family oxidoreductase [Anaerobacillus alkalidiazotrophicus]OIJ18255.1 3-oxoacyl-ACP reductase [Anaerobacillus alkalidiazotrophicus]OIJ19734.1 3-oxoacyl-ACP reductase [Anaerobacillus alkalidiazotrophicus]
MRHVLITAGTKGLGKKISEQMLEKGHMVTISYRSDQEAVKQLSKEWKKYEGFFQFFQADVTKKEDLVHLVEAAVNSFGAIHILINNAGPYVFQRKKLVDYSDSEWYEMLEGNLSSVFHLIRQVIPMMKKEKFGRIITCGFQGAESTPGWIYRSAFAAAKVGLVSLTKTIAIEEAENGITANMVCPGNIVGKMKEASIAHSRNHFDQDTPIGRSGTGEDIGRMISFLCEENSDMITGAVIEVTGGVDVLHRYR